MASNYVTSDGVDLDSRYLGKNAKAASASYADSAGTATNVTNKGALYRNGNPIQFSLKGSKGSSYTVSKAGVVVGADEAVSGSVATVPSVEVNGLSTSGKAAFVQSGDVVRLSDSSPSFSYPCVLYPMRVG